MRLVIDGTTWENERGYGRFTREIVRALGTVNTAHELILLVHHAATIGEPPAGVRVTRVPTCESPAAAARANGYRSPRDLWVVHRAIARESPDVVFFPTVYTFVPVARGPAVAVAVHDVIPERFPRLVFPGLRSRWLWTAKVWMALRQASRIITVSNHARDGIVECLSVDASIVRVIHEAPAIAFRPVTDPVRRREACRSVGVSPEARLVIYVGGLSPHKNLAMLIDVVCELARRPRFSDTKLLLIGNDADRVFHSAAPALRAQADAAGTVIFTGYQPDDIVASLLSEAAAFVLPSFDEGFGLPGIEAAACGAPVVATRSSALPEVLGDTAVYFDPYSPSQLREALERFLDDPTFARSLGERAAAHAATLSWETSGRRLLDTLEELGT